MTQGYRPVTTTFDATALSRDTPQDTPQDPTDTPQAPVRASVPAYIRLVGWMMTGFLVLFTALVLGGYWLYEQKVTARVVDTRPCGLTTERMSLTGVREYSYLDNSLFNYHWHDRSEVDVTTRLNVPFDGLTVVAIQADTSYEALKRGDGEGGVLILPTAHHYVFYNNGNVAAITDAALCK